MMFAGGMGSTGSERRTLMAKSRYLFQVLVYCDHVDGARELSRALLT